MHIKTIIAAIALALSIYNNVWAVTPSQVKFGNAASDTTAITRILMDNFSRDGYAPGELVVKLGEEFIGVPYRGGTLEGMPEELTVNLDGMDCMSFVENVLALAVTLEEKRTSWIDFVYNLERLRYRGGNMDGYSSRLHYFSDWVVDNSHRGLVSDVTARIANPAYQVKTLEFMSRNRDKYPALADSLEFERLKGMEMGYRSHRYPYIKSTQVDNASIRPGDIIAVTTKTPGLDVSHVGIAVNVDGKIHLLHASSKEGKVCVTKISLAEYLKRNRGASGIRVIRLSE
ncbi:MAG: DUF1460 domain-containing protein [Muribaculaceae bacterium]|nr:DUF1460 domain-containing protein [Muribaculaceae bacterium]